MTVFEYATLPVVQVLALTGSDQSRADSYISDDQESRAYFGLLKRGFRWVRTDGDFAVFERSKYVYPRMKD